MMKHLNLTALFVAFIMVCVSFASTPLALCSIQKSMADMVISQNAPMMGMKDCLDQKAPTMTMDASKCALACYGLATSVAFDAIPLFIQNLYIVSPPAILASQALRGYILGVPTPPPDFV